MVNAAKSEPSGRYRHLQRIVREFGRYPRHHRPAHNLTRPDIHHCHHTKPSLPGSAVRDVGVPAEKQAAEKPPIFSFNHLTRTNGAGASTTRGVAPAAFRTARRSRPSQERGWVIYAVMRDKVPYVAQLARPGCNPNPAPTPPHPSCNPSPPPS